MNDFGGKAKSYNVISFFLSFYNLRSNLLASTLINGIFGRFIHPIASAFGGVPGCLLMGHVGNVSRTISLSLLRNLMISLSYEKSPLARWLMIYIIDNAKFLDAFFTISIYFLINLTVITLIISNVNYSKGVIKKLNYMEFYVVGLHSVLIDSVSPITYVRLTYSQLFWTLFRRISVVAWILSCNLEVAILWMIAELVYFSEDLSITLSVRHSLEARTYGISKSQLDAIESESVLFTSTSNGQTVSSSGRFVRNCLELASHCLLASKGEIFSLEDGTARKVVKLEVVGEVTDPSCVFDQIIRYHLDGASTSRAIPTISDSEIDNISQIVAYYPQDGARVAITHDFTVKDDCIFYDIMTRPGDSSCPVYGLVKGELRYLGLHSQGNPRVDGYAVCIREKMSPKRRCLHTENKVFTHVGHEYPKTGLGYRVKKRALLSQVASNLVGALSELGRCLESLDLEGINGHFDSLGSVIDNSLDGHNVPDAPADDVKSPPKVNKFERFSGTLTRIVKMLQSLGATPEDIAEVRGSWPGEMDKPSLFINFFNKVIEVIKARKQNPENSATSYLYCRFQASLTPNSKDVQFRDVVHDALQGVLAISPDFYEYSDFHSCLVR